MVAKGEPGREDKSDHGVVFEVFLSICLIVINQVL